MTPGILPLRGGSAAGGPVADRAQSPGCPRMLAPIVSSDAPKRRMLFEVPDYFGSRLLLRRP